MEQKKLDRINALARKSRTAEGLTAEEKAEQQTLRQEYIQEWRNGLRAQLENTVIVEPDGTRHKVQKRPQAPKS